MRRKTNKQTNKSKLYGERERKREREKEKKLLCRVYSPQVCLDARC